MLHAGNDAPGSNKPGPGVIVYLTPQGTGNAKGDNSHGWGTPFGSFWCCYGSTVETYAKLADSIYFYRLVVEFCRICVACFDQFDKHCLT